MPSARATIKKQSVDFNDLGSSFITITSSSGRVFAVHSSISSKYSSKLKHPLGIELRQTKSSIILLMIKWMYTNALFDGDDKEPSARELYDLYFLADMLSIPGLQNDTLFHINQLQKQHSKAYDNTSILTLDDVQYVYYRCKPKSLSRQFLVDSVVSAMGSVNLRARLARLPSTFVANFTMDIAELGKRSLKPTPSGGVRNLSKYLVLIPVPAVNMEQFDY